MRIETLYNEEHYNFYVLSNAVSDKILEDEVSAMKDAYRI
jgi:hypothetical protein